MTLRDLPRAREISDNIGFPRSDSKLVRSWLGDQATSSVVVVVESKVVAYLMYQRCVDGFAILQLRVDPAYQWRGIGRALIDHLKD
jgi:ribosomal protein S18 acetylase RimI-like enzyme